MDVEYETVQYVHLTPLHQFLTYFPMRLTSLYVAHKTGSYVQESLLELKWLL